MHTGRGVAKNKRAPQLPRMVDAPLRIIDQIRPRLRERSSTKPRRPATRRAECSPQPAMGASPDLRHSRQSAARLAQNPKLVNWRAIRPGKTRGGRQKNWPGATRPCCGIAPAPTAARRLRSDRCANCILGLIVQFRIVATAGPVRKPRFQPDPLAASAEFISSR